MKSHQCTVCGQIFLISEAVRSPSRIFKNNGWSRSYSEKISEYFMVTCPKCAIKQISQQIRMFGVFGPRTALLGLPIALLVIILAIFVMDRLEVS